MKSGVSSVMFVHFPTQDAFSTKEYQNDHSLPESMFKTPSRGEGKEDAQYTLYVIREGARLEAR